MGRRQLLRLHYSMQAVRVYTVAVDQLKPRNTSGRVFAHRRTGEGSQEVGLIVRNYKLCNRTFL